MLESWLLLMIVFGAGGVALLWWTARRPSDHIVAPTTGRWTGKTVGEWDIGPVVGRGAVAEVYEGHEVGGRREAAIKIMHPGLAQRAETRERFVREGNLAGKVNAPNVVRIRGRGETESGDPYLAMELLRGEDLGRILAREGRLDLKTTNDMLRDCGLGVDAAHAAGIVHRDLKPKNLFRHTTPEGETQWKVLDFGVMRLGESGTLTSASVVGTPDYMAPEQAHGATIDHRVDVWSMGAVAYRCLTGALPFEAPNIPAKMLLLTSGRPLPPRALLADLPQDVERVLALAMAPRPEDRFDSATALADAFDAATRGELEPALRVTADHIGWRDQPGVNSKG